MISRGSRAAPDEDTGFAGHGWRARHLLLSAVGSWPQAVPSISRQLHQVRRMRITDNEEATRWCDCMLQTHSFLGGISQEFQPPAPTLPSMVETCLMCLVNCAKHQGKSSILTTAGNHLVPWSMKFDYPYLSLSLNQELLLGILAQGSRLWNDTGQSAEISQTPFLP